MPAVLRIVIITLISLTFIVNAGVLVSTIGRLGSRQWRRVHWLIIGCTAAGQFLLAVWLAFPFLVARWPELSPAYNVIGVLMALFHFIGSVFGLHRVNEGDLIRRK